MVTLGTLTPLAKHSPAGGTNTFTAGFTPATGDVVVAVQFAGVTSLYTAIAVSIGGANVTGRVTNFNGTTGASNCQVWLGTVRGLATGSALDVVVTWSGGGTIGSLNVVVADLVGWSGTVGVTPSSAYGNSLSATGPTVSGTLVSSGGLLLGCVGSTGTTAITTTGWTQDVTDSDGTTSTLRALHKTSGAAGASDSLAPTSGSALRWGVAWMELYDPPARPPSVLIPDARAACAFQPMTYGV